jgi:DNA repair exonuclease SbcCD ATPase subunit
VRINRIEVENFMRLGVVQLTPQGNVVQITGKNKSGKSSFLNAIFCCLAGAKAVPARPIHEGETSARIKLDLGEVIITRKFSASGETSIVVEQANGARFQKPQQLLESLYSAIAFDPMSFVRADPKQRLEILRKLVPLDVDVEALDGANACDYELRRDWNRKIASLKDRVQTLGDGVDMAMDTTPIDVEALTSRMADASNYNANIDAERARRSERERRIERANAKAGDLYERARELRRQADEATAEGDTFATRALELMKEAEADEPFADPIDVSDLREQINQALRSNALRDSQERQRAAHQAATDELTAASAISQNLTEAMDARTAEKAAAIARAPMPIDGLGFGDGDVLFKNIPFDQASTAEQWIVAMSIGAAANPKLAVVLIRDGSLLDEDSQAVVDQFAEEKDLQVFIETVRKDSQVGVVFEAGRVTAIDGVPVEREAEAEPVGA